MLIFYRARFLSIAILALLLLSIPPIQAQQPLTGTETLRQEIQNAERVPVNEGERCIVCDKELPVGSTVRIVRGRRMPLMEYPQMLEELLSSPAKYFSKRQPKGALFDESIEGPVMNFAWMFVGLFSVALVVLGGYVAARRMPCTSEGIYKVPTTLDPIPCSSCSKPNHPSAKNCSTCGAKLEPEVESEVDKVVEGG